MFVDDERGWRQNVSFFMRLEGHRWKNSHWQLNNYPRLIVCHTHRSRRIHPIPLLTWAVVSYCDTASRLFSRTHVNGVGTCVYITICWDMYLTLARAGNQRHSFGRDVMLCQSTRGAGSVPKLEGQERFFAHFYPCNALGLMLNFAKVGGTAAPSAPPPGSCVLAIDPTFRPVRHLHFTKLF